MKITDLLTKEQHAAALETERRWLNWLGDPAHNTAPNPKANAAAAQREYKSAGGDNWKSDNAQFMERLERASVRRRQARQALTTPTTPADPLGNTMITRAQSAMKAILREREQDPEPSRDDIIGRAYWARREEKRRAEMSHWRVYLP